jgi:hypothetical protein
MRHAAEGRQSAGEPCLFRMYERTAMIVGSYEYHRLRALVFSSAVTM